MKALYLPGPAYHDTQVAAYAGWHKILEYQRRAILLAGFEVVVPEVPEGYIDNASSFSQIASYSLYSAAADNGWYRLIVGAPSFAHHALLKASSAVGTLRITYVWNQADWFRDEQLIPEFERFNTPYPTLPTNNLMNEMALRLSGRVIANSEHVKRTHARIVPEDRIRVAHWGVDSETFHPAGEPSPGFRVLFFGGNPVRKGLTYLLEALNLLEDPRIELWVLGCDPWQGATPSGTKVFGMVPHAQVPEIIRQCHVLVLPTLEDGMPLAVQECMASGVVPVTTECAADAFSDGAEGFVVPYRDPVAIAKILGELKLDRDLLTGTAARARVKVGTQTWERFMQEFADAIRT